LVGLVDGCFRRRALLIKAPTEEAGGDLSREHEAIPLLRIPCPRVWPGTSLGLPAELLVKASGSPVAGIDQKLCIDEAVRG
jgi:hypothetical protein